MKFADHSQNNRIVKKALAAKGLPLDPSLRSELESRFSHDFSKVRIHTDLAAAASARSLGSEAFTVGSGIFFAEGRYAPCTEEGIWLLAHELAHVIQQAGRNSSDTVDPEHARELLENQADRAAGIIAAGKHLPFGFSFTNASPGMIQCHEGPACPGIPVSAKDRIIWMPANEVIETAYKNDPRTGPVNSLFFGSQFETGRDVLPPAGFVKSKFAKILLKRLRGLVNQRRPDIIDFHNRVMYEIKTVGNETQGRVQLESYYKIADEVRRAYASDTEPPWKVEYATWYPPHVLPFPTDPLNKIVCTRATDHTRWPGLIL